MLCGKSKKRIAGVPTGSETVVAVVLAAGGFLVADCFLVPGVFWCGRGFLMAEESGSRRLSGGWCFLAWPAWADSKSDGKEADQDDPTKVGRKTKAERVGRGRAGAGPFGC